MASFKMKIDNAKIVGPEEKLQIRFDDPPGPSPARFVGPIRDIDSYKHDLQDSIGDRARRVELGGVYSGAFTGESYVIIIFALGGIAGGLLGAIGQDIWNGIKKSLSKILQRNGARRNIVELGLEFQELDVIFHIESRSPLKIPPKLDDLDTLLLELKNIIGSSAIPSKSLQAIEIRITSEKKTPKTVLYSYRRAKFMLNEFSKSESESGTQQKEDNKD